MKTIVITRLRTCVLVLAHVFRAVLHTLLSLALGADECVVCGKPALRMQLCGDCLRERVLKHPALAQRCTACGKPLISETGLCMKCRTAPANTLVSCCYPVFPYRMWMKDVLSTWKMQGVRIFSPLFARIIFGVLSDELFPTRGEMPVIVPVPPRPGKFRKKGWDQVEDLAAWLELRHRVPVLRILKRRPTVEQKKLDKKERGENAQKAYYLDDKIRKKIDAGKMVLPKRIMLLDDVRTTGTTLETCAHILQSAGVEDVQAVVLFSVD
jgi:ComF family protein